MKKEFKISPYQAVWKSMFQAEKEQLLTIFGDQVNSIHHIGSTAIPTTQAKPEIDLLLVIKDDSHLSTYDKDMEALGYRVRGECLDSGGTPGRYYYSKDIDRIRTHKLHICQVGHPEIMAKLLFVKYLNEHEEAAIAYAELKQKLSLSYNYGRGIDKYLAGKTDFILKVLKLAGKKYETLTYEDFLS